MSTIANNLKKVQKTLPANVSLITVSKSKPIEAIAEAYLAGQRAFGENKTQEMAVKYPQLPLNIQWHFVGHLQSNKVKYIASFVHLIHSVDSVRLLEVISKHAKKHNRTIDCLLQFYISQDETKYGFTLDEADEMLQGGRFKQIHNIRLCGVMGMATLTDNSEQIRQEFQMLKRYFDFLKEKYYEEEDYFKEISMGMSDDYLLAVAEGATMVRIGSAVFGKRE